MMISHRDSSRYSQSRRIEERPKSDRVREWVVDMRVHRCPKIDSVPTWNVRGDEGESKKPRDQVIR